MASFFKTFTNFNTSSRKNMLDSSRINNGFDS